MVTNESSKISNHADCHVPRFHDSPSPTAAGPPAAAPAGPAPSPGRILQNTPRECSCSTSVTPKRVTCHAKSVTRGSAALTIRMMWCFGGFANRFDRSTNACVKHTHSFPCDSQLCARALTLVSLFLHRLTCNVCSRDDEDETRRRTFAHEFTHAFMTHACGNLPSHLQKYQSRLDTTRVVTLHYSN